MDIKHGLNPGYVERQISVNFTREEVLAILAEVASKQGNTKIKFESIQGLGVDNKLTTLALNGTEQVPLVWTNNKPAAASPPPEHTA
jgi:hypothetical protein